MELYPGFSLYRGLFEFGEYSGTRVYTGVKGGMKWENLNDPRNGMKEVMIIMLVEWVVVLLVAFYVDQINSSGKSPLFFLENSRKKQTQSTMNLLDKDSGVCVEMEKEDVAREVLLILFSFIKHVSPPSLTSRHIGVSVVRISSILLYLFIVSIQHFLPLIFYV